MVFIILAGIPAATEKGGTSYEENSGASRRSRDAAVPRSHGPGGRRGGNRIPVPQG